MARLVKNTDCEMYELEDGTRVTVPESDHELEQALRELVEAAESVAYDVENGRSYPDIGVLYAKIARARRALGEVE